MTLLEMISRCRSRAFDTAKPYFWSDEQWTDALNEAEEEACIRARLLEDDSIRTVAVEQYAYVKIPPEAFIVRRVLVGGNPIDLSYQDDMASALHRGWESDVGTPLRCYRTGDRLRLHPIPIEAADVILSAFCTPTTQMLLSKADDDTRRLPVACIVKLIDWALARFTALKMPIMQTQILLEFMRRGSSRRLAVGQKKQRYGVPRLELAVLPADTFSERRP